MKPIYTTIPIKLCEYALVNRKVNHLMLFIYLKHISSGHVSYSNENIRLWAIDINKSEKWVKSALKWLIKNGWITVNSKRQSYRVVSYKQLFKKLQLKSLTAVVFEPNDFSELKSFCCAVVIAYSLFIKRLRDKKRQSVSIMDDTSKSCYFHQKGFIEMPLSYLAKDIGVSVSTANNYKRIAKGAKLLIVKRQLSFILDIKGCLLYTSPSPRD